MYQEDLLSGYGIPLKGLMSSGIRSYFFITPVLFE
jgi:hypothetical protein